MNEEKNILSTALSPKQYQPNAGSEKEVNQISGPKQVLSVIDAIVVILGIVVGAGIFRTPSFVAANTGSWELFMLVWILGGVVSLVGAMCYAELTAAFPNTGGDYHFLHRAFGRHFSFLFAWARMSIIQTGSIALLAFIVGDYMADLYTIGPFSSAVYASLVVIGLTAINIIGIHVGTGTQKILVSLQFLGLFLFVLTGLFLGNSEQGLSFDSPIEASQASKALGAALIMVLLTFGGWNEAGYISAEMRGGSKKMATVMISSILLITGLYLLINFVYLRVLGIEGMAQSDAVGLEFMRATLGQTGVIFIGILVMLAALTSANATIFTGARTNHALGKDFHFFSFMGRWGTRNSTPVNALLMQGAVATLLIVIAAFSRSGFESMVDFTAPVFWFFILCTGIALFVLRYKEPYVYRPFKVPLYPVLPLVFCLSSGYLLYSSLAFAGKGAWFGIGVLVLGMSFFLFMPKKVSVKNKSIK